METFVVRVFVPAPEDQVEGLRGTVEHVPSGRSSVFVGLEQLGRFLESGVSASRDEVGPHRPLTPS